MKQIIIILTALLSIPAIASTPSKLVSAKPSKATIYLQGAFVTRDYQAQIRKGIQKITFIGLTKKSGTE